MKNNIDIRVVGIQFNPDTQNYDESPSIALSEIKTILSDRMNYQYSQLSKTGCVRIMGYMYNFTAYLKRFVLSSNNGLEEVYSFNKTLVRKTIGYKLNYIMEIK